MALLVIYIGVSILSFIFKITCPTFEFNYNEKYKKNLILKQVRWQRKIIPNLIVSFIPGINVISTAGSLIIHSIDIDKLNDIVIRGKQ